MKSEKKKEPVNSKIGVFKSTAILMSFFTIHRIISFAHLNQQLDNAPAIVTLKSYLIGVFSDFWTAVLGALILAMTSYVFKLMRLPKASIIAQTLFTGSIAILTSLHSAYVSFFQFPFIPSHISYFTDADFLRSNFGSVFDLQVVGSLLANLTIWLVIVRMHNKIGITRKKEWYATGFAVCLGLAAHVFHNRYKVQWFIPESLQFNYIEGFVNRVSKQIKLSPLSDEELKLLQAQYADPQHSKGSIEQLVIGKQKAYQDKDILPISSSIKQGFKMLKDNQEKPLIIVYLMESARYYDTGAYGNKKESLTPKFDMLANTGILFHQVWSVSNVTRGGQEAIWCGYLSAIDRSLMKERQDIEFQCLTDYPEAGASFWHHGGEGRFDNQQWFWKKHNVKSTLSIAQIPADAAKTGWGTSDLSLVHHSASSIAELERSTEEPVITGMVLTVSNHIPWELPSDAPKEMNDIAFRGMHPSEKTVFYADHALGEFVAELKKRDLWKRSIMIVTGDHGIRAAALNSRFTNISPDELNSRVPLLISGGIVEHAAINLSQQDKNINLKRSQADIANFIADMLGIDGFKSMGEHLFSTARKRPIFADLGTSVYFPISQASIFKSKLNFRHHAEIPSPHLLYYISLLHYIDG